MGRKTNLIAVGRGERTGVSGPRWLFVVVLTRESGMVAKQRDRAREARHLSDMG
jgi:hypothetical protein